MEMCPSHKCVAARRDGQIHQLRILVTGLVVLEANQGELFLSIKCTMSQ